MQRVVSFVCDASHGALFSMIVWKLELPWTTDYYSRKLFQPQRSLPDPSPARSVFRTSVPKLSPAQLQSVHKCRFPFKTVFLLHGPLGVLNPETVLNEDHGLVFAVQAVSGHCVAEKRSVQIVTPVSKLASSEPLLSLCFTT